MFIRNMADFITNRIVSVDIVEQGTVLVTIELQVTISNSCNKALTNLPLPYTTIESMNPNAQKT